MKQYNRFVFHQSGNFLCFKFSTLNFVGTFCTCTRKLMWRNINLDLSVCGLYQCTVHFLVGKDEHIWHLAYTCSYPLSPPPPRLEDAIGICFRLPFKLHETYIETELNFEMGISSGFVSIMTFLRIFWLGNLEFATLRSGLQFFQPL